MHLAIYFTPPDKYPDPFEVRYPCTYKCEHLNIQHISGFVKWFLSDFLFSSQNIDKTYYIAGAEYHDGISGGCGFQQRVGNGVEGRYVHSAVYRVGKQLSGNAAVIRFACGVYVGYNDGICSFQRFGEIIEKRFQP